MKRSIFRCFSQPKRVAITGATGQVAYNLIFRIANGALFGEDQSVVLQLYDIPKRDKVLRGLAMELEDCAFPLVEEVIATDVMSSAIPEADCIFLVGGIPRTAGMERRDLLRRNGEIFVNTGKILNKHAKKDSKILTIANPCNTNCLIALEHAKSIPRENFSALMMLDHNRAVAQIAKHLKVKTPDISKFCVWGNHSPTMYPDINHATLKGQKLRDFLDKQWVVTDFIPTIETRGTDIMLAMGHSSVASGAHAAVQHMKQWIQGTQGEWTSMAVSSDLYNGEYGVPPGLVFSYPVTCENGDFNLVKNLKLGMFSQEKIKIGVEDLLSEKEEIQDFLNY